MPPKYKWTPVKVGLPLDQQSTPLEVGGRGLTDGLNFTYDRAGGWGKRSGSGIGYQWSARAGAFRSSPYYSGIRWYRAYPSQQTKTVFAIAGSLWVADGPGSTPTKLIDFVNTPQQRITFCSARDPNANNGNGSDVLIICGGQTMTGFGNSYLLITTSGPKGAGYVGQNPAPTAKIVIQFKRNSLSDLTPNGPSTGGSDPFEIVYAVLPTDDATTIAQNLSTLINQAYPVATNAPSPDSNANTPFLGQSFVTGATNANPQGASIHLGALFGGAAGNQITMVVTYISGANGMGGSGTITFTSFASGTSTTFNPGTGNVGTVVSPTGFGIFQDGGSLNYGPLKWDGTNPVDGLSYQITKGFTGCRTWHDHVWFWGAESDPDTLFAADIDQPEGFDFMTQNGGYDLGVGDGDPFIQNCVPIGNQMYAIKTSSIYGVTGYDFQAGEYQFNVQPVVSGYGIPTPDCVDVLDNSLVLWTGKKLGRLAVGSYEIEHIGYTVPLIEGAIAMSPQSLIRVVAGDFQEQTLLNDNFLGGGSAVTQMSCSKFYVAYASPMADGVADTLAVYDDLATQRFGKYSWLKWSGWNVAGWLPFGLGPNNIGGVDNPLLLWIAPLGEDYQATVYKYGSDPVFDTGNPIPWFAQTGWGTADSPELAKNLHRVWLQGNCAEEPAFTGQIVPGQTNLRDVQLNGPVPVKYPPMTAPEGGEAYNIVYAVIEPSLLATSYLFQFTEDGTSGSSFELCEIDLDIIPEEAAQP